MGNSKRPASRSVGNNIRTAMRRVATPEKRRAKLPTRVPIVYEVRNADVKLATERKLLNLLFAETDQPLRTCFARGFDQAILEASNHRRLVKAQRDIHDRSKLRVT